VLVNSSLPEGTTLANTAALKSRLQTLFSNATKSIQRHKKGARARSENKTTHFAIYQEEVICSLTTEATDASWISEETDTIELFGKHLFAWLNAHIHNTVCRW